LDDFQIKEARDPDPRKDFFEAFDDGFNSSSRASSKAGVRADIQASGTTSHNMLGDLKEEIV